MNEEIVVIFFVGSLLLIGPLVTITLAIVAFVRSRRINELQARVMRLEQTVRQLSTASASSTATSAVVATTTTMPAKIQPTADQTAQPEPVLASTTDSEIEFLTGVEIVQEEQVATADRDSTPMGWETFVGQKAFGWIAVVLFIFASAFFLRYAYQNNWIGPLGRVAIAEIVGVGLMVAGWRNYLKGWKRFSGMLNSVGTVVLYLATYSAFGFYGLLPQQHAGLFLAVIVIESMLIAVLYDSLPVAIVAVAGGLLTPILLASSIDTYQSFFTYLSVLNVAVVFALRFRPWPAVGSLSFLGTQVLYWMWYHTNYHPEKFAWALGIQLVLLVTWIIHGFIPDTPLKSTLAVPQQWERRLVFVLNAILGYVAIRSLTLEKYSVWQSTITMSMAVIYAASARIALQRGRDNSRLPLMALAVSIGFVAWTFPIQADANWVALGWAAMGLSLWYFGMRIASGELRILAAAMTGLAVGRVLTFDLPLYIRDPFIPIFNTTAFPSLCVSLIVLAGVLLADRFPQLQKSAERWGIAVFGVLGMILLLVVLSFDCYGYFVSQSMLGGDISVWRWRGQLALTVLWTCFATLQLILGFRMQRARVRWMAMTLFAVTVLKVFVVDMANVQQLYRIAAFFVLAVVLGLVARAYQKFR